MCYSKVTLPSFWSKSSNTEIKASYQSQQMLDYLLKLLIIHFHHIFLKWSKITETEAGNNSKHMLNERLATAVNQLLQNN